MVNNEVVITYKRKRFSLQSHKGIEASELTTNSPKGTSPKGSHLNVQFDTYDEKPDKDNSSRLRCFKCENFDLDENLLLCGCCSKSYHFHCTETPQKTTKRKWHCTTCHGRNDFKESLQYHIGDSSRRRKDKSINGTEVGPTELRSRKLLLRIKLSGGQLAKASSSAADCSLNKAAEFIQVDCTNDKSGPSSTFTDLDIEPKPTCLNSSSEIKYTSGCPEGSMMLLNSSKTNEHSKENHRPPLITFSRREKKKWDEVGKLSELNSKSEGKQCSLTTMRGHLAEATCTHEGSSQICSFKYHSATAAVLLEQSEVTNAEKDCGLESTNAGGLAETKIACDEPKGLPSHSLPEANISNENQVPSQHTSDFLFTKDQSKKLMAAVKNSVSVQADKQSNAAHIGSSVLEESSKKLIALNSAKTDLPCDDVEEREQPCELVFSVTPAANCMGNIKPSKPLIGVVAENLLECQCLPIPRSSTTPADEETDGRENELEWLEDLDRALQEKKKNSDKSLMVPAKSFVQSTYHQQCFKCGNFEADQNLLRCECCSETCHFHCTDNLQKRKWQCSTCHKRNDFREPRHFHVGESTTKSKTVDESEMGPIELHSHELLNIKNTQGCSEKASSPAAGSSVNKATDSIQIDCAHDRSGASSKFVDPGVLKPNLTSSNTSGCPEISFMTVNSDKIDGHTKEDGRTPLITFSRRVKKKLDVSEKPSELNSKSEGKQYPSTTLRRHAAEASCMYGGSCQTSNFKDQLTSEAVLLEQSEVAHVEKDAGLKSTAAGGFGETNIYCNGPAEMPSHSSQETNTNKQHPVPPEDQSNKLMVAAAIDFINNSVLNRDNNQPISAKMSSYARDESGNKFDIMNSEKTNLPYDVQDERINPIAPPASTCMSNVGSSTVAAEYFVESQSSSTPSDPKALVDEETDGRCKELEWLEDLDRMLQEKKKIRDTCLLIDRNSINCGRTSISMDSPCIPAKSFVRSTFHQRDASPERTNQTIPLHGNVNFTKLDSSGFERQSQCGTSVRTSHYTNFLGLSLPRTHGGRVDPVKDVQNMLSSSSSGVKDNVHEMSFLRRHKRIVDNDMKERQYFGLDMFSRYSNEWSEQELDFLWIGVRRHGVNNWNAVLRDPKLHFLESRVAEELAMQWDVEQRKLLHGTLVQPLRFHRADCSSAPFIDEAALLSSTAPKYGFPALTSETKLSLGDLYHQKRNLFRGECSSSSSFLGGVSIGRVFPKASSRHQMPIRAQNKMHDLGSSTLHPTGEKLARERQSFETMTSNLPHWLKGVVADAPHNVKTTFPYNAEPFAAAKDSLGRGILKRKSGGSGNRFAGLRTNDPSSLLGKNGVTIQNRNGSGPFGPSDLMVIGSQVSSEETISDDGNSRG